MLIKFKYQLTPSTSKANPPCCRLSCRQGYNIYTVVSGDTMAKIARRYNVTVDFLSAENPHISNPNLLFPGDLLCVPPVTAPGTGRIPASCPASYQQYTVQAGDTLNQLAASLGVSSLLLIETNPHITDPNVLFVGDVLCVPLTLKLPCCAILQPTNSQVPAASFGAAVIQQTEPNQHTLGVIAVNLPAPSSWGDFDMYESFVEIAGIGGYGFTLGATTQNPSTWSGALTIQAFLSAGNRVIVRPANSESGLAGNPLLSAIIGESGCLA